LPDPVQVYRIPDELGKSHGTYSDSVHHDVRVKL
jgi:hypothetical protein